LARQPRAVRRYGYASVAEYGTIVDGYRSAGIPLGTFVSDSQYMRADQDFTLGAAFPPAGMQAFVAGLHGRGQRWVRARTRRPRGGSAQPEPAAAACPCPAAQAVHHGLTRSLGRLHVARACSAGCISHVTCAAVEEPGDGGAWGVRTCALQFRAAHARKQ